ncbi:Aste57867_9385 [Aphanomyces stellatus]|uniref:Aste57867_9385 protein n=1 Tax=Aphanomyces stellatus TaxID=120398 RepID=A0A485KN67_9STRA|nr:hypothetical protein As57867_009349 [Aphanomyces stellatus]VFT86266.1 Aste57867_9385 [Aphanomyces stellatus]
MWKLEERTCDIVWATQRIPDVFTALKEVVYNSIDAEATAIVIALGADSVSFTVNDNGHGIRSTELCSLLFGSAATSKDASMNENGYKYNGWRGDSLFCISQLSKTTVESRENSSWNTYSKVLENGHVIFNGRTSSKKCIPGTVVTIENLFGNVPARQRQMLGVSLFRSKLIASVKQFCIREVIAHGHLAFEVIDKLAHASIVRLAPTPTPPERLALLSGRPMNDSNCNNTAYMEVDFSVVTCPFHIQGVVIARAMERSPVNLKRAVLSYQCIRFNNIWVQGVEAQWCERLRLYVQTHNCDIPMCILNVQCPPSEFTLVDEPSNRTALFRNGGAFDDFLDAFLHDVLPDIKGDEADEGDNQVDDDKECVSEQDAVENIALGRGTADLTENAAFDEFSNLIWTSMPNRVRSVGSFTPHGQSQPKVETPLKTPTRPCPPNQSSSKYFPSLSLSHRVRSRSWITPPPFRPHLFKQYVSVLVQNARTCRSMAIQLPRSIFQHLRVIQQLDKKFILVQADSPPLLLCIDQHAADERVKLEALEDALLHDAFPTCAMEPPVSLALNGAEMTLVRRFADVIAHWGFVVDLTTWSLLHVPMVDHRTASPEDFLEYLCLIATVSPSIAMPPPVIMRFLHSRACRSAIMFGDPLTLEECEHLIAQLSTCRLPFQCAHGRPSIVPLVQLPEA